MYLVPRHLYHSLTNRVGGALQGAEDREVRGLNNLDVHDGGKVTIHNKVPQEAVGRAGGGKILPKPPPLPPMDSSIENGLDDNENLTSPAPRAPCPESTPPSTPEHSRIVPSSTPRIVPPTIPTPSKSDHDYDYGYKWDEWDDADLLPQHKGREVDDASMQSDRTHDDSLLWDDVSHVRQSDVGIQTTPPSSPQRNDVGIQAIPQRNDVAAQTVASKMRPLTHHITARTSISPVRPSLSVNRNAHVDIPPKERRPLSMETNESVDIPPAQQRSLSIKRNESVDIPPVQSQRTPVMRHRPLSMKTIASISNALPIASTSTAPVPIASTSKAPGPLFVTDTGRAMEEEARNLRTTHDIGVQRKIIPAEDFTSNLDQPITDETETETDDDVDRRKIMPTQDLTSNLEAPATDETTDDDDNDDDKETERGLRWLRLRKRTEDRKRRLSGAKREKVYSQRHWENAARRAVKDTSEEVHTAAAAAVTASEAAAAPTGMATRRAAREMESRMERKRKLTLQRARESRLAKQRDSRGILYEKKRVAVPSVSVPSSTNTVAAAISSRKRKQPSDANVTVELAKSKQPPAKVLALPSYHRARIQSARNRALKRKEPSDADVSVQLSRSHHPPTKMRMMGDALVSQPTMSTVEERDEDGDDESEDGEFETTEDEEEPKGEKEKGGREKNQRGTGYRLW